MCQTARRQPGRSLPSLLSGRCHVLTPGVPPLRHADTTQTVRKVDKSCLPWCCCARRLHMAELRSAGRRGVRGGGGGGGGRYLSPVYWMFESL